MLADRLSAGTGIPWHEVDNLTYEPGWVKVPDDEQRRRIAAICAGERWILDIAYSSWFDVVLPRVELIVALDLPRAVSFARLVRRTIARVVGGRPVCNGNRESLRTVFARDSIVVWHFRAFASKRRRIEEWEAEGRPLVRLRSARAVEGWISAQVDGAVAGR